MKKLLCTLLAIVMVISSFAVVASAYSWDDPDILTVDEALDLYEFDWGERPETFTYYFLMPDGKNGEKGDNPELESNGQYAPTWYKLKTTGELATSTAGIYWWDSGVADPAAWIGYIASGSEECDPNIYYANVPIDVTTIVWNNAVDGGLDETDPIYKCAAQSVNIGSEYYDAGESPNYPDGTESFDGMIFVIDPDLVMKSDASEQMTCGGEWYYYYGNGCYGFTEGGSEADCLRDDHYDENGNHVIPEVVKPTSPEIIPTEPETEPETEPTEPETEPTEPETEPTEPETEPTEPETEPTEPETEPTEPETEPTEPETEPTEPETEPFDPADHTWTAVGAIAPGHTDGGCLGAAWNPANTANDLVYDKATGLWSITYTDVAATGETDDYDDTWYEYKIAADHAWDLSFNDNGNALGDGTNAKFDVEEDGSTVTIYFDGTKCWAEVVAPEVDKYEIGDVDGDGLVSIVDVSEIQLHLASVKTLDRASLAAADANGDGEVNILDATHIQRFLAKLIKEL